MSNAVETLGFGLSAVAVAFVGIAWALAIYFIPQSLSSRFRYRLWRIRDELVDSIQVGTLPDDVTVQRMLDAVEMAIAHSDDVRLSVWLTRTNAREDSLSDAKASYERYVRGLDPESRAHFDRLEEQFRHAFFGHLVTGSPSGWAALAVVVAFCIPVAATSIGFKLLYWPIRKLFREAYYQASQTVVSPSKFVVFSQKLGDCSNHGNGNIQFG